MVSGALAPGVMTPSAELAAAELPVLAAEASGVTCHIERSPCHFRSGVAPGFLSEAVTTWGQPQDCPAQDAACAIGSKCHGVRMYLPLKPDIAETSEQLVDGAPAENMRHTANRDHDCRSLGCRARAACRSHPCGRCQHLQQRTWRGAQNPAHLIHVISRQRRVSHRGRVRRDFVGVAARGSDPEPRSAGRRSGRPDIGPDAQWRGGRGDGHRLRSTFVHVIPTDIRETVGVCRVDKARISPCCLSFT